MDQLGQVFEHSSDGVFRFQNSNEKQLSYFQLYSILQSFTNNLTMEELLDNYVEQLRKHLPVEGVTVEFMGRDYASGLLGFSVIDEDKVDINYQSAAKVKITGHLPLSNHQQQLLRDLKQCIAAPLKMALQHEQMKRLCYKDQLTGLGNRHQYNETIGRHISHSMRSHNSFGLLIIDLDHFKQANDRYGHLLGDQILMAFANVLKDCLRDTDYAFRFGGDEFCCLLEDADPVLNQRVCIRILNSVSIQPLLVNHGITCSIGSALYQSDDTSASLFHRADEAMYAAKQAGKNCIKCV
ncbi:diguanylate cyclase domain-containing protein [Neptunicella marina]|uniref:diguanylate cyclase n=1 Tax=Neptunicella marina TaxID=2125989 RepID=A0A8J6IM51_9ALTE|nr:GGDEF domain-containing protein [Neptunicella marina]